MANPTVHAAAVDGGLVVDLLGERRRFHPMWLLERSNHPSDIDPTNRQRLFEPTGVAPDLIVTSATVDEADVRVWFSDGVERCFALESLARSLAAATDREALPTPEPWERLDRLPTISWADIVGGDLTAIHAVLGDFHRLGCFRIDGAPTEKDSLRQIASSFGRISPTSFGELFDVMDVARPSDLAYTPVGLSAHTDQPYRRPAPGLQFLHALCNDAPGGESTMVDGLAAVRWLERTDPEGHRLLSEVLVEFRYDTWTDVVVNEAPIIESGSDGTLRQIRFSPRLDFVPYGDTETIDRFYAARRRLAAWLADPEHTFEFKLNAGDVWVVDNHRVLHGRRPFDPAGGRRHLQGCYIDHDGPATMWRLLTRRIGAAA